MENPDLVLQETRSRPTYSRLNYVPSGDTLHRDAISSLHCVVGLYTKHNISLLLNSKSCLTSTAKAPVTDILLTQRQSLRDPHL